jgi:hypothetical protein
VEVAQPAERDYLGHTFVSTQKVNQYELALGSHARSGEQFDIWQAGGMQLASATSATPARNITTTGSRGTRLALKSNQVIDVAKYHRQDDQLIITDTQGRSGSVEIADIHWAKTAEMTGSFRFVDTPQLVAQQH